MANDQSLQDDWDASVEEYEAGPTTRGHKRKVTKAPAAEASRGIASCVQKQLHACLRGNLRVIGLVLSLDMHSR